MQSLVSFQFPPARLFMCEGQSRKKAMDVDSHPVGGAQRCPFRPTDEDAEIEPVPASGGGRVPEPELDRLSNIIRTFNDLFRDMDWKDADKISRVIAEEIPTRVAADRAYQNAMNTSDKQNARIEHDRALQKVIIELLSHHTELFKHLSDNPDLKLLGRHHFYSNISFFHDCVKRHVNGLVILPEHQNIARGG